MKTLFLVIPALLLSLLLMAQPPKGTATSGTNFGTKTTAADAHKADDLPALLKEGLSGKEIKVQGKVVDVCKAEGCWLKMETATGPIMIRMKNHAFMVPVAMNGKNIVAAGTAEYKETSVEMLKHYAEDAGKSKEEIDAIKEPKKEILMQATGILVL
jgi:hypothetical protein